MEDKNLISERLKTFLKIEPETITPHESLTKKQAEQVFRENRVVIHNELGTTVLSVETVDKIIRHKGFDTSTIIKFIPDLYKKSVLIERQIEKEFRKQEHKKHNNIAYWHNTLNKFKVKNKENKFDNYVIRFTTAERKVGKNKKKGTIGERYLHSSFISSIFIEKTNDGISMNIRTTLSRELPSDKILAHYFEIVKDF